MQLSLVSHYYDNPLSLQNVVKSFTEIDRHLPGDFDFVLVDDHSHAPVDISVFSGVANLRVFRINEDVPWNMPAARNIGVREALCDKIVLTDIDHSFDPANAVSLLAEAANLKIGQIANFRRRDDRPGRRRELDPHPNSFMIHKSDFERVGGYEESFSGNYGAEDTFFRTCCKRNDLEKILFDTALRVHGSATRNLTRDKSKNTELLRRLVSEGAKGPVKTMSYTWKQIFPSATA